MVEEMKVKQTRCTGTLTFERGGRQVSIRVDGTSSTATAALVESLRLDAPGRIMAALDQALGSQVGKQLTSFFEQIDDATPVREREARHAGLVKAKVAELLQQQGYDDATAARLALAAMAGFHVGQRAEAEAGRADG